MSRRLKRFSMLSTDSYSSEPRSRSVTPVPKRARGPDSDLRSRRCLNMVSTATSSERQISVEEEPRVWRMPRLPVPREDTVPCDLSPGGRIYIEKKLKIRQTPGGSYRRKRELEQSVFLRDDEIAAEMGLELEEGLEALEDHQRHMGTWFSRQVPPAHAIPSHSMSDHGEDLGVLPSVIVRDQADAAPGTSGDHAAAAVTVSAQVHTSPGTSGDHAAAAVTVSAQVHPAPGTSGDHAAAAVGPSGAPRSIYDDPVPSCSGTAAAGSNKRRAVEVDNEGSDLDSDYDDEFDVGQIIAARNPMRKAIPDDDELEADVRDKKHLVEAEMDAAIDRLIGESGAFEWQEDFGSFKGAQETFSGPTPGPVKDYDTPYEAFCDIWDESIIELMVTETNKYARQTIDGLKAKGKLSSKSRLHRWTDTDANEIRVLLAMYMLMGIDQRSSQHEYWKTSGYLQLPYFRSLLAFNRFILLNKFLHFTDNCDVSPNMPRVGGKLLCAKLKKIAPLVEHLNSKFESLYNLQQDVAIDESLTLFKGRLSWVQAIRTKAARFGIKSFELCESRSGYLYRFQIYTGKNSSAVHDDGEENPSADLAGKSTQVVLDLLKGLENRGHCVTMDNYYNSPALARHLKKSGYDCLGTLRSNRKNVPEKIKKLPKKVQKGQITALHCGDVACISWQDSKMVNMISTYHNSETILGQKAGKEVLKPCVVQDYNNTMGGVDVKDQKLAMYLLERKRCVKWYMKIFKRLLNCSVHNAFILYNESRKRLNMPQLTHREFRVQLADSLLDKHHVCPPDTTANVADQHIRLKGNIVHIPKIVANDKRKRCHMCNRRGIRKDVSTKCVTCDQFLCFENCWSDWHSLQQLPGKDVRARRGKRS